MPITPITPSGSNAPNDLPSDAAGAVAVPNTLPSDAAGAVAVPNTLPADGAGSVASPVLLPSVAAAAAPRTLTPMVNLDFAAKSYARKGRTVLFDDLLTYTRPSSATFINRRIDVDGGYEYFLDTDYVGNVTNLASYSEDLTDADWVKSSLTVTGNAVIAPDGSMSADKLTESNGASYRKVLQNFGATLNATMHTFSIQVKSAGRDWVVLRSDNLSVGSYFNISTGTLGTDTTGNGASITSMGNGWYECSISIIMDGVSDRPALYIAAGNENGNYQGDGVSGIYAWGAQVTESLKVLPYVKTLASAVTQTFTETLRVEYDAATGENLGALIEGGSTNLCTYSEDFSNAGWNKGSLTSTANAIIAPDGTLSGDLITITVGSGHALSQPITVIASTQYAFSFYVKKGTATDLKYSVWDSTNLGNIVAPTSYFTEIGTDWTRISVTFTAPVGCTTAAIYPVRDSGVTGTAYIWGAQLEALPFASSYIRTEGAAVSRSSDNLSVGAENISEVQDNYTIASNVSIVGFNNVTQRLFNVEGETLRSFQPSAGAPTFLPVLRLSNTGPKPTGTQIASGVTTQFVLRKENITQSLFQGGVIFSESILTNAIGDKVSISIGKKGASEYLFGHISKFSTYAQALTAQEITLL